MSDLLENSNFDVFISYNNNDKAVVFELVEILEKKGLKIWIDKKQLLSGKPFLEGLNKIITKTPSAIICVGKDGLGGWQKLEVYACFNEYIHRSLPLVVVLLPDSPPDPDILIFLKCFTWIDFTKSINPEGIEKICQGVQVKTTNSISESPANDLKQIKIDRSINKVSTFTEIDKPNILDTWGVNSIKSRMFIISKIIAEEAYNQAKNASTYYKQDILSILVPLIIELRWFHGYAAAVERLLKIPSRKKYLRDYQLEEILNQKSPHEGVLSAEYGKNREIKIMLNGIPVASLKVTDQSEKEEILESINNYGLLGVPNTAGLKLIDRIGEVPIRMKSTMSDKMATYLYKNREVIIPLLARFGIPTYEWHLHEKIAVEGSHNESQGKSHNVPSKLQLIMKDSKLKFDEVMFDAIKNAMNNPRLKTRR